MAYNVIPKTFEEATDEPVNETFCVVPGLKA